VCRRSAERVWRGAAHVLGSSSTPMRRPRRIRAAISRIGNWRGEGVARIGARHTARERQVGDGARQGSTTPIRRTRRRGEASGQWRECAGALGLATAADPAKVSGRRMARRLACQLRHRAHGGIAAVRLRWSHLQNTRDPWVGKSCRSRDCSFRSHQGIRAYWCYEQDCAGIFEPRDRVAL